MIIIVMIILNKHDKLTCTQLILVVNIVTVNNQFSKLLYRFKIMLVS